ncbi:hypothetical protein BJ322DRAFT_1217649 [Thelephora terrestris]|uniref:Uncharacterized protein n=1 Tax=Thelephora terrestris TaxID=56493 RepID=A0A9P6HJQ3_9AGAM|nr:hypothetical protein BJ322DRAFT_1217649 [Thelephora terrestris]
MAANTQEVPSLRRKWPENKFPVSLDSIRSFHVRAKVVGPSGVFVKSIQKLTNRGILTSLAKMNNRLHVRDLLGAVRAKRPHPHRERHRPSLVHHSNNRP